MYKSKTIKLEKLKEFPDRIVYKLWKLAMSDAEDCWGMGSELLMYDDDLYSGGLAQFVNEPPTG